MSLKDRAGDRRDQEWSTLGPLSDGNADAFLGAVATSQGLRLDFGNDRLGER